MTCFIKDSTIANYSDDNIVLSAKILLVSFVKYFRTRNYAILDGFRKNEIKPNDDKCHLIICNQEGVSVTLGNEKVKNADSVELLGITIDKYTEFCKKRKSKITSVSTYFWIFESGQTENYNENLYSIAI